MAKQDMKEAVRQVMEAKYAKQKEIALAAHPANSAKSSTKDIDKQSTKSKSNSITK